MDSSGSKRNRPNYDKEIQGQKNQVLQEKEKYKIRDSNIYSALSTSHAVKVGSAVYTKAFNGLPTSSALVSPRKTLTAWPQEITYITFIKHPFWFFMQVYLN